MTKSLGLLALFTVGVIVGAYVYHIPSLNFLVPLSGIFLLYKISDAINIELLERRKTLDFNREARRILASHASEE